ncbi:MAG: DUF6076 domain-containing protein [Hungatella sp.]|nr:DUF6076 domain-containing protein [Hungatella sp.]
MITKDFTLYLNLIDDYQQYSIRSFNKLDISLTPIQEKKKLPGLEYFTMYMTLSYGSLLIEYVNTPLNELQNIVKETVKSYFLSSINNFDIYELLGVLNNTIFHRLGLSDPLRCFLLGELKHSIETLYCNYIDDKGTYLLLDIHALKESHDYAKKFCNDIINKVKKPWGEYPDEILLPAKISYTSGNKFIIDYMIDSLDSMVYLEFFNVQKYGITFNQCENCGKYFVPTKRSDEKYCDNFFKDGKTCKDVGYEMKIKNDEFKTAYRTAYKTQRARIKYNSHISNYEEIHFKPWEQAAKQALSDFTTKNDIEGFKKWLKANKDSF